MYKLLLLLMVSGITMADSVSVTVKSNKGNPVFQAIAYVEPLEPTEFPAPQAVSVMDQINSQFVPHILAVQKGSQVSFPNSDSIKHHVYSFSTAKTFELQLYKGIKTEPLGFTKSGEVELGCNVHDWMLGYIFVVNTPYFAKTDQTGAATIDVPPGNYKVSIWHPRIQDDKAHLTQPLNVPGGQTVAFQLQQDLLSDLTAFESEEEEFSDYD